MANNMLIGPQSPPKTGLKLNSNTVKLVFFGPIIGVVIIVDRSVCHVVLKINGISLYVANIEGYFIAKLTFRVKTSILFYVDPY